MTNDEELELFSRAICMAEKMNPDDILGGWKHWTEAGDSALLISRFIRRYGNRIDFTEYHPQDILDDILCTEPKDWSKLWAKPKRSLASIIDPYGLDIMIIGFGIVEGVCSILTASRVFAFVAIFCFLIEAVYLGIQDERRRAKK